MADVNFDSAFESFCITYDRLWVPTKGGIVSIGMYWPGPTSSPPRESIRVKASKEVLDMIPNEFMGWPVIKSII